MHVGLLTRIDQTRNDLGTCLSNLDSGKQVGLAANFRIVARCQDFADLCCQSRQHLGSVAHQLAMHGDCRRTRLDLPFAGHGQQSNGIFRIRLRL